MGNESVALSMAGKLVPIESLDDLDLKNLIATNIDKADSLIHMTYGVNGDSFRGMCEEIQDNVLWAISDLLRQAKAARNELADRRITPRESVQG
ncbi:hypothetical protein [Luteibacter aegosomatissinici]|uniref:hypothetical protein n=1 Tax=Luteibacter aegosomatissinici TaxID=2911539 RepID=UPI001FF7A41B|nr:hypothetical protein [Luteibacter aegosomatissinici]UPG96342.1 hypothetical protein L2Y97_09605 [Luteibacter aegosomatissinici]